ncbi:MAG: YicC family protein [Desulfobulbaceae bacterium]|nr:YicC family protein [Desulfobulbaceae bacterium]
MTIKSMTGFGRGEFEKDGRVWTAEVRCVNNRYLDLKMKLPRGYSSLEEKIRKKVAETHLRGRVDLFLSVSGDFSDLQEVKVNLALAGGYRSALQALSDEFGLKSDITPQMLATYPDVLTREQKDEDLAVVWEMADKVIDTALESCDTMRSQEGEALAADLIARLQFFEKTIEHIEKNIPELLEQRQKNLQERLEKLLANVQLDPARLAQEVAVISDKTDVTEEIVRLRCHIAQFTSFLTEESGIGRKLDFLIQEFLREVNTLASKINDATVAHLTVDLKSELEKMREQVQNIE